MFSSIKVDEKGRCWTWGLLMKSASGTPAREGVALRGGRGAELGGELWGKAKAPREAEAEERYQVQGCIPGTECVCSPATTDPESTFPRPPPHPRQQLCFLPPLRLPRETPQPPSSSWTVCSASQRSPCMPCLKRCRISAAVHKRGPLPSISGDNSVQTCHSCV